MAETLLTKDVADIIDAIDNNNLIDKWFFIRYTDKNGFHIRLRFHVIKLEYTYHIIKIIEEYLYPLLQQGRIHNVSYDTYIREIERYGVNNYDLTESIFHIDSCLVLQIIKQICSSPNKENIRFKIALMLIDSYLDAFNLGLNDKFYVSQLIRDSYRKEFNITTRAAVKTLDMKYRKYRDDIFKVLSQYDKEVVYYLILHYKETLCSFIRKNENETSLFVTQYIGSIIHMSINRLFVSQNRLNELVLFDFICRYYESIIARNKYNNYRRPSRNKNCRT